MLGKLLSDSGAADRVVGTLVNRCGRRLLRWAIALVAIIIGLPMFFEIGLVLLLPVIVVVTRKSGLPLRRIGIPAVAGLSALHGPIPPHPGPLIAISAVKAHLGVTLGLGILVAIPTVIVAGPLFAYLAARWVPVGAPSGVGGVDLDATGAAASADLADERAASACSRSSSCCSKRWRTSCGRTRRHARSAAGSSTSSASSWWPCSWPSSWPW